MNWKLETAVNYYVKKQLENLGLKFGQDFRDESDMSDYMKSSLMGASKTGSHTNFGKPDFHSEKFLISRKAVPVIIEDKVGVAKLINGDTENVLNDKKSVANYAVNGAISYARKMINSRKYDSVVAIGVAGDSQENVKISVYYVYDDELTAKFMPNYTNFNFLANQESFEQFIRDASLSDGEKHKMLIHDREELGKQAKALNRLMHNHNITAPQRVLYVSGMLLAMQSTYNENDEKINDGLKPEDLKGVQAENNRDGKIIIDRISDFLSSRNYIPEKKKALMLSSFSEINKDQDRDSITNLDPSVAKFLDQKASTNKQIFTFIYENIFLSIDRRSNTIDIMGEMYSEFLKYALGDGKEIGIVLTPPYITKMMSQILDVDLNSRVMDLATGSAGFLIAAMEVMIEDANKKLAKGSEIAEEKIREIKEKQLMGVELNAEMYTLAATNMILRGDGSSNIQKGDTFETPESIYDDFRANKILLNPPFSFRENGMPFIKFGLEKMEIGGRGAIIIQDSAGSGKAVRTNKDILQTNQLLASIKMPVDLFVPMAGVQTSIYIFEHTGKPHDCEKQVRFIDFREDGYKRAKRGISEINNPVERYQDIVKIFKNGRSASNLMADWDLQKIVIDDEITDSGADWNFDQHQVIDTRPTEADFMKVVSDYLAWEVGQVLKGEKDV